MRTNIPTAVAARAAEMGGTVVQMVQGEDAHPGKASGLVHWKRPNEHLANNEEHVTHLFYVSDTWKDGNVAIFEAGTYGDQSDAETAWERRVVTI